VTGGLLVFLAVAAAVAPSRDAAKRSPVRVDADEVQYAFQKHEVVFSGKKPVTLVRDDATLTCRRIVARTDEQGQIVTATCTGDVRFVRGLRIVTCEAATFDNVAERVVCVGSPILRDRGSEARGTRLVYDLRSDEAKLEDATITLPGEEIDARQRALEQRRKERQR
jgi:lipopolysaccharide export system protein LptA